VSALLKPFDAVNAVAIERHGTGPPGRRRATRSRCKGAERALRGSTRRIHPEGIPFTVVQQILLAAVCYALSQEDWRWLRWDCLACFHQIAKDSLDPRQYALLVEDAQALARDHCRVHKEDGR
jgi:hypothetical protein